MSTILPLFWDLSSSDKKKRLDTSVELVATLQKLQATFENESAEPDEPSGESLGVDGHPRDCSAEDVEEHNFRLDVLNSPDVAYSIRRLLRGLASPRESSRLGFAVALTELLSRVSTVSCSQILALVLDASRTTGNQTGQEERDLLFARLFGLASIVHSGLLIRTHPPLPQSASAPSTPESCEAVLKALRTLARAKSWLAEAAYWAIGSALDLLAAARDEDLPWREKVARALLEEEFGETSSAEERAEKSEVVWTPEKIALALRAQRLWPEREHEWRWLWTPTFKRGNIFHQANLVMLARILRETGFEGEGDNAVVIPGRAWKPQVHHIWDELLDQLLPLQGSGHTPNGSFPEFFRIVVDESLFSVSASNERKYWGFAIFKKALPRVKAADLPMLFTKNFMRTWINHLSHPDRYLHSFAKQIATVILSIVQKDPSLGFAFVLQLTGIYGNQQFDKLTRTRTVESILMMTNAEGIKNYIAHLLGQVDGDSSSAKSDVQPINPHRSWIVDQFAALIRNGAIPKDDGWIQQILDWLTVHGIFVVKKRSPNSPICAVHKVPSPPFTDDLRHQCRERLLSCLADLTRLSNVTQTVDRAQRMIGVTSDGDPWISRVLQTIRRLEQDSKHVELLSAFGSEDRVMLERACNLVTKLKKVSSDRSEDVQGVELLLQSSILQFYLENNTDERDVAPLESCIDGTSRLFPSLDLLPVVSRPFQDDEHAIEPIDVLVDVIIGFLEKGTAYMRAAGNQSFSLLSGAVKDSTINLILSQLEHRDPSDLVVDSDEDSSVIEDDSPEAGHDNDSESPSADEHNETLGSNEAENEGFEKTTEECINSLVDSSDEGSEPEPDDDQMMVVDDLLAQLFKDRIRGKKSKVGAQREATHFKNRILDLLSILVKKQPKSAHIMQILVPLLTLAFSDEKQLSEKAIGLLRSRIDKLKVVPSNIDVAKASDILNDLHVRARKVHSGDALTAISFCSLYVSKALLHVGADTTVRTAYTLSLVDFTERKASDLNTDFFSDFIKRHPRTAWDMREALLAAPAKALNAYRRGQAYILLQALLVCLPPMPEDELDKLAVFMGQLQRAVHSTLSATCDADTTSTQSFKEALKLTLVGTRTTKRLLAERATSVRIWEPAIWAELCDRLKQSASLVELCRQIVKSIQAQQPSLKTDGGERVGRKRVKATAGRKRKADDSVVTNAAEKRTKQIPPPTRGAKKGHVGQTEV